MFNIERANEILRHGFDSADQSWRSYSTIIKVFDDSPDYRQVFEFGHAGGEFFSNLFWQEVRDYGDSPS